MDFKNEKTYHDEAQSNLTVANQLFLAAMVSLISIGLNNEFIYYNIIIFVVMVGFGVSLKIKALKDLDAYYERKK